MRSKKIKVIIKSSEQLKAELVDALEGKRRRIQPENEMVFNSVDSFMKTLTKSRLEILMYLTKHQPNSIYELAKGMSKNFKNVHSDVKKLAELDLIILEPTGDARKGLRPEAKYTGLELELAA